MKETTISSGQRPTAGGVNPRDLQEVTLFRTMLRPKWLLALLLAMVVAAGFAYLGKWQLGRAIQSTQSTSAPTEQIKEFTTQAQPSEGVFDVKIGQRVRLTGHFVPDDYTLIADRLNRHETGYWVVGHFTLDHESPAGKAEAVAVARGWAPSRAAAAAAQRSLAGRSATNLTLTGRMLPTEEPAVPPRGMAPRTMTTLAVADLVNRWHGMDDAVVYTAYVVEHGAVAGLDEIYSPPPIVQHSLDLLNVFYAIEWVVFAGFALYLWYRIVKDSWEREYGDQTGVVRLDRGPDDAPGDAGGAPPPAMSGHDHDAREGTMPGDAEDAPRPAAWDADAAQKVD